MNSGITEGPPSTPTPLPPVQEPTPTYPTPTPPTPPTPQNNFQSGYYYFDFEGSKYDYQAKLTAEQAKLYSTEALSVSDDAFKSIKYFGQSKLGDAGFQLFGKSQGYL